MFDLLLSFFFGACAGLSLFGVIACLRAGRAQWQRTVAELHKLDRSA